MGEAEAPPGEVQWRWWCWLLPAGAVVAFHVAYGVPFLAWFAFIYLLGLVLFAQVVPTPRKAFYGGLVAGIAVVGPWMWFLTGIFGATGVVLWSIVAAWTGLFVLLARYAFRRLSRLHAAVLVPFLWTGVEYFRCELYPLRFTWLTPGFAFAELPSTRSWVGLGVYGTGFVMTVLVAFLGETFKARRWVLGLLIIGTVMLMAVPTATPSSALFRVAGLQLEGVDAEGIPRRLDALLREHPKTDLVVLPEYTFAGPVPGPVRDWCRRNRLHLVAGGMDLLAGDEFRNTAFVIGPDGEEVFRQVKSVPIQFFKDGLPATEQRVWESPWGRIGICVCYDLSYTRVVDRLVERGAQVLVVPTLDAKGWGETQHRLHARVAPMRAAEYGLPVVRVCSSGISQVVDAQGEVVATAPFPGEGASIAAEVRPSERGRLPVDRWLAPFCSIVAGAWMAWALVDAVRTRLRGKPVNASASAIQGVVAPPPAS